MSTIKSNGSLSTVDTKSSTLSSIKVKEVNKAEKVIIVNIKNFDIRIDFNSSPMDTIIISPGQRTKPYPLANVKSVHGMSLISAQRKGLILMFIV